MLEVLSFLVSLGGAPTLFKVLKLSSIRTVVTGRPQLENLEYLDSLAILPGLLNSLSGVRSEKALSVGFALDEWSFKLSSV